MSHSVTIQTRTVTTGSPSSLNTGFCKSWTGLLKIAQVVLGFITVCLVFHSIHNKSGGHSEIENLLFLLVATSFLMTSLLLVLSSLCSFTTESIVTKTIFELLYHAVGFALLLAASVLLFTKATKSRYRNEAEKLEFTASIVGVIIVALEVNAINTTFLAGSDIFLMLMATAFMIGTAIFIISYIFSPVSEAIIGKTNYDLIYNVIALTLLLIASVIVIAKDDYRRTGQVVAGYFGLIMTILYGANAAFAVRNKI